MMKELLDRINALAKKSREEGLNAEEKEEQARLRAQYLAAFRANAEKTLSNVYILDENGNEKPLTKTKKQTPFS